MSIIISTENKNTQYSIIAKNTNKFRIIEEKFYDAFPELKVENVFYLNENQINKNKTLDENNIVNSSLIIIKTKNN